MCPTASQILGALFGMPLQFSAASYLSLTAMSSTLVQMQMKNMDVHTKIKDPPSGVNHALWQYDNTGLKYLSVGSWPSSPEAWGPSFVSSLAWLLSGAMLPAVPMAVSPLWLKLWVYLLLPESPDPLLLP